MPSTISILLHVLHLGILFKYKNLDFYEWQDKIVNLAREHSYIYYLSPVGNQTSEIASAQKHNDPIQERFNGFIAYWKNSFRAWMNQVWYRRISATTSYLRREGNWPISCFISSQYGEERAFVDSWSYFWSNTMNAFMFAHGPMTTNLANVIMLTGMSISHPVTPFQLLDQTTHKLLTKDVRGWKKYISTHSKTGSVG